MTDSLETPESEGVDVPMSTIKAVLAPTVTPIDMVLYCPSCGKQHIDAPSESCRHGYCVKEDPCERGECHEPWGNPPHRSHLCHECGCIWRPADVPTNGVASTMTKGKADTWFGGWSGRAQPASPAETEQRPPNCGSGHCSCIECRYTSPAQAAIDALEQAKNGLEWYRDRCPGAVDGSDDEMDAQIDAAIAGLKETGQ